MTDTDITPLAAENKPASYYCCLNFGCPDPEMCDAFGYSCGDPRQPPWPEDLRTLPDKGAS